MVDIMLHTQRFLIDAVNAGGTATTALAQLTAELGIKVRDYPDDGIVLLDYNQIDSPKTHPVVVECRSLILNRDTFSVVSRKMDRFFNLGEAAEHYHDFSFDGAIAYEKADGSLIGVYHNPITERWEISTRGMAKAEGEHAMGGTFRERVLAAFGFTEEKQFQLFGQMFLIEDYTYVFEYTGPENRVVTPYEKTEMVLLAVTPVVGSLPNDPNRIASFVNTFELGGFNVRVPKTYSFNSPDELNALANSLTGLQEGFVVYDPKSGKRVKVKATDYLYAHRLRGENAIPTRKNILELVLEGETSEVLAYFPEFKQYIDPVEAEVADFLTTLVAKYESVKHIEDQKEFALAIRGYGAAGVLFSTRKVGSNDPVAVFRALPITSKWKLFGL